MISNRFRVFLILLPLLALPGLVRQVSAAETPQETNLYQARTLDGVNIDAVETYLNPRPNEFSAGVGWYPFNPYYNGLSLTGAYTFHLSRKFAWEVVSFSYLYTFQRGLTAELADRYSVNPQSIERLNSILATHFVFTHSSGKLIFLENFLRYFRSSVLLGPGLINTSQKNVFGAGVGLRFEVHTSRAFSWKLDVKDMMTLPAFNSYVSFTLSTGYYF